MKKILILLIISLLSITIYAQDANNDIIYPLKESKPILNCQILEITEGNMVLYILDGIKYQTKAIAVKRNGEYIDFKEFDIKPILEPSSNTKDLPEIWRGKDYNYYFEESKKAKKLKASGMFFTALGLGTSIIGFNNLRKYINKDGEIRNSTGARNASLIYLTGIVIMNTGIPLWIAGGIKHSNNIKAMQKCKKPDASLNIGVSADGLGLVYRF